jgi:hypothetical protein
MPADNSPFALGSVLDGHALQIDELKGTKKINLSNERLGVASAIIIATCIKESGVLKELKCRRRPECSPFWQCPLTACLSPCGSVDRHALPIAELKGTKPTKKIDLSRKGLSFNSAIIIASCIKENGVLKELKCAAARQCPLSCQCPLTFPTVCSLASNQLCGLDYLGRGTYITV